MIEIGCGKWVPTGRRSRSCGHLPERTILPRSRSCDVRQSDDGRVTSLVPPPYATHGEEILDGEDSPNQCWDQLSLKQQSKHTLCAEQYACLLARGSPHYRSHSPDVHAYEGLRNCHSQGVDAHSFRQRATCQKSSSRQAYTKLTPQLTVNEEIVHPGSQGRDRIFKLLKKIDRLQKMRLQGTSMNQTPWRTTPSVKRITPRGQSSRSLRTSPVEDGTNRIPRTKTITPCSLGISPVEDETNRIPRTTSITPCSLSDTWSEFNHLERLHSEDDSMNLAPAWGFSSSPYEAHPHVTDKNGSDEDIKLAALLGKLVKDTNHHGDHGPNQSAFRLRKILYNALSAAEGMVSEPVPEPSPTKGSRWLHA